MALSQYEIDRIYEEERVRREAQDAAREEEARRRRPANIIGWVVIALVALFLLAKYPEWQREQRERQQFRDTLDSIVQGR